MGRACLKRVVLYFAILAVTFLTSGNAALGLSADERREIVSQVKGELDGSIWDIKLTEITDAKKKEVINDALYFSDGKVKSGFLESSGFNATNYTVSIKGNDDTYVWETMQSSEKKGLAFWHGEIENGVMRGVLSWHVTDSSKKDYTFVTTGKNPANMFSQPLVTKQATAVKKTAPAAAPVAKKKAWWQR